ncbi:MAG: septal ring lytic transglycosylase RlpA family protein [Candidatus Lambdaproteobacteria bacterium]|nr:septal ring lytic transglycosylase RlpA family protein [Candidatus Lambdaproteobacteria bacterium]
MAKGRLLEIALFRLMFLGLISLPLSTPGCAGSGPQAPDEAPADAAPRGAARSGWSKPALEAAPRAPAPWRIAPELPPTPPASLREPSRAPRAVDRRANADEADVPAAASNEERPRSMLPREVALQSALTSGETPLLVRNVFPDFHEVQPLLEGVASWYGPTFHGKATASGETYNQFGLTAAHPMLPMGTRIIVENLENQRRIYVRINDRGPYKKGRVVDLSYSAAKQLGMLANGTAPVRITVVQWPTSVEPALGLRAYRQYVVQVASYPSVDEAETVMREIQSRVDWTALQLDQPGGGNVAVICGPFDSRREALWAARRLQGRGITSMVRSYRK